MRVIANMWGWAIHIIGLGQMKETEVDGRMQYRLHWMRAKDINRGLIGLLLALSAHIVSEGMWLVFSLPAVGFLLFILLSLIGFILGVVDRKELLGKFALVASSVNLLLSAAPLLQALLHA